MNSNSLLILYFHDNFVLEKNCIFLVINKKKFKSSNEED